MRVFEDCEFYDEVEFLDNCNLNETMMDAIRIHEPPPSSLSPAVPKPDDWEMIFDQSTIWDEPILRAFLDSLGQAQYGTLSVEVERRREILRMKLPAAPCFLSIVIPPGEDTDIPSRLLFCATARPCR